MSGTGKYNIPCIPTVLSLTLVRKHVPDSDPGCALQSTSMPALHQRTLPNCRPMVDGGIGKCSAGACPPLGAGWGVAQSARAISLYRALTPAFHTLVCRQSIGPSAPTGRLLYSIRRLRAFSKCVLARLDERIRCLHLFDLNRLRCKDNSREVPIAISPTWNYRSKGVGHRARHKHLRAHAQPPY